MTLSDLASLATVISSAAVLVSLVYLSLQIRQNTKHTRAMIQQARNVQIIDGEMLYATDPVLRDIAIRGDAADPSLTGEQVRAYMHFVSGQLMLFEDLFYQYKAGLIDAERHASTISAIRTTKAIRPGFRAAWEVCKHGLGHEFRAFVERILAETKTQPQSDMSVVWRQLTAKELRSGGGQKPV